MTDQNSMIHHFQPNIEKQKNNNMKKAAICFTPQGKRIIERINSYLEEHGTEKVEAYIINDEMQDKDGFVAFEGSIYEWAESLYKTHALIFVCATGIAVRAMAGLINDKLSDNPVIVMDDAGRFVIPLSAGHVGGANKLTLTLAGILDAIPVITTSTDVNEAFSADVFAMEKNLRIVNREGIKKVSAKAIEGKPVTISVKDYPPKERVDVIIADSTDKEYTLLLSPKPYTVGIGMKKNTDIKKAEEVILSILNENAITTDMIYALCTIDIKQDEEALIYLRDRYRIPLITFDAALLNKADGEFTSSDFVKQTVGVDNVCERAAVLAAGNGSELILNKLSRDGITVAIAKRKRF